MTEQTFVRELERQAEHVRGAPLTFESVRGRARQIRRRRRTAVVSAVAAAVAVVAIAPTVLTGDSPRTAPDPAPPSAPGASVLHDGTLTFPDGGTLPLEVDNADVAQVGVLTDGRVVLAMTDPYVVRVYAADGTIQKDYEPGLNSITMSAGDDAVAWIGPGNVIQLLRAGSGEPAPLGEVQVSEELSPMIDAVVDGRVLVGDGNVTTAEYGGSGARPITTSEPLRVTDVSPDGSLWAVQYADDADPQFGCAGLYDPQAQEMVARSCETAGLRFSPDGQHLLGMRGDNRMFGEAATYDLDLEAVGQFESGGRGQVISQTAWLDPQHVLVAETDWTTSDWSLAKVGIDWSEREVVVPEAPGRNPEMVAEFLLSE